jgi:hypothetical protein
LSGRYSFYFNLRAGNSGAALVCHPARYSAKKRLPAQKRGKRNYDKNCS